MKARVDVTSEWALVAACDSAAVLPSGTDQDALFRALEPMARFGKVFFLVTDDPVQYRIDLFADEPPPRSLDREFEAVGGSIRLAVPSGRMVLRGWNKAGEAVEAGAISVSAGTCLLSVMTRRSFDGARHVEDS